MWGVSRYVSAERGRSGVKIVPEKEIPVWTEMTTYYRRSKINTKNSANDSKTQ